MILGDVLIYLALLLVAGALPGLVTALRMPKKKAAARASRRLSTILLVSAFFVTFSVWALMTQYFLSSDMSYAYVHSHSSTDLDWTYKISAVWSGGEGSFLLWVLSMQGGLLAARLLFMGTEAGRTKEGLRLMDIIGIVGILLVLMFLAIFNAMDPFRATPMDQLLLFPEGKGLNVLLQHPLMATHPMLALIAYGLATVTFVSSVAFLVSGNRLWAAYSLNFTRAFFLLFSIALTLGGLWAYETLGWGGFWGWDPVETSSLFPWLLGAVVCHSQVQYVKRNQAQILGATTAFFMLPVILFATFTARSGLWVSVHSYAAVAGTFWAVLNSSNFLRGIFSLTVILCVLGPLLLARAYMYYYEEAPKKKTQSTLRMIADRTNAMLFGSVLTLMGLLVMIFIVIMRLGGNLSAAEFELKLGPLALIMVCGLTLYYLGVRRASAWFPFAVIGIGLLMGLIAYALYPDQPLGAFSLPFLTVAVVASIQFLWRSPKAKARRHRIHDAGATMLHLGLILMLLGYSGSTFFSHQETLNLSQGSSVKFDGYELEILDMNHTSTHLFLTIQIKKDGAVQGIARPGFKEIDGTLRSEVSIVRLVDKDIYFVIEDSNKVVETGAGARAQVTVKVLPGINALWCGAVLVVTGTALRFLWNTPQAPLIVPARSSRKGRPEEE
jgi:cytochrome c-type biogenesis protein CcmF